MAFSFNGFLGLSPKEVPKKLSGPNLPSQPGSFVSTEETLETIQNQALWNEARGQEPLHTIERREKEAPDRSESDCDPARFGGVGIA